MDDFQNKLNPLPIAISILNELNSDQMIDIISRSGISIDLILTTKQNYSHVNRKRAYISRINKTISEMDNSDALRAIYLIFYNLVNVFPDKVTLINERLSLIGWKLIDSGLYPSQTNIIELFFEKGLIHDAYIKIREIIESSQHKVIIIDPYVDRTLFELFKNLIGKQYNIKILTFNISNDFEYEKNLFCNQHKEFNIEVRKTNDFHDRFIIIDDSIVYHLGASIKDAGKKAFMINQIQDKSNITGILESVKDIWT